MLGQTLTRFSSEIARKDVARPNRFSAMIMPPGGSDNSVNLMVQSAEMPGQNIRTTADMLRYGPQREIGNAVMYADSTSMTFICTTGMPEKVFFENWQARCFNRGSWRANYYSSYIGKIALHSLDKNDSKRYVVYIEEAYPKTIVAQTFSQENNNAYQTLTVEFAFRHWNSHAVSSLGGLGAIASVFGLSEELSSASSILGAAKGIANTVADVKAVANLF